MTRPVPAWIAVALALCACGSGGRGDPGPGDLPATDLPADAPADAPGDLPADAPGDPGRDLPGDPAGDPGADAPADLPADAAPDAGPDAPDVPPPPAPHPLFDFVGGVLLEEADDPASPWGRLEARFQDAPDPLWHLLTDASGDCELWWRVLEYPGDCPAACGGSQYCGPDGQCHPYGQRVAAGAVTVDALGGPYALAPDDTAWYTPVPEPASDLFAPGMSVRVRAAGDAVPAFDVTLPGMAPLRADVPSTLALRDDADAIVAWTPAGDGAQVEVVLQTGHHIPPPVTILYCRVPESAGRVVIPKALVAGMPPAGGIGLFPHPSFLRKVRRAVVEGPQGPLEVSLQSRQGVSITHNAW